VTITSYPTDGEEPYKKVNAGRIDKETSRTPMSYVEFGYTMFQLCCPVLPILIPRY
jgi:hypothetical protein